MDINGHGYNITIPALLYHINADGTPGSYLVRATLVSDVFTAKDYMHSIQFKFNNFPGYDPTRGDILTGVNWSNAGGAWDLMDAFTSQDLSNFVPLGLTEIDDNTGVYTFQPLILISGKQTASMFEGGVYKTTTFGGIDILKNLLYGASNWWNTSAGAVTDLNPFQIQKDSVFPVVTVEQGLNARIPNETVKVDLSDPSKPADDVNNIKEATIYSFDPLDTFKKIMESQTGGLAVIYYCPARDGVAQLQFKNDTTFWGASDWTQQRDGVLVSADALNISEVTKENYKNAKDKYNLVQCIYNKVEDGQNGLKSAKYRNDIMVTKTSRGYAVDHIDSDDKYSFKYPDGSPAYRVGVPVKTTVNIDKYDDQTAVFEASSKLNYLWDKPFSLYTIKANLSNSFMLTQYVEE